MIYSHDEETIIAQCTPKGAGAIALLRLSGSAAIEIATHISTLASGKKLIELPTHTLHYGWIINDDTTPIDQVLFLLMHAPHTFTGQNTVEITCHNNPFIIEMIIQQAIIHGARLAKEGEFSKRAVLNSKIDVLQAEAINELIHAHTQQALKQSLAQLKGSFSHWITAIEHNLIQALAFSEASFEFLDEEMSFGHHIKKIVDTVYSDIASLKKTFDQQHHIRQGIRIAIIGSVNVGKSSLFNALLNQKRSIVTNIAGTTRDTIEAGIYKQGNYWTLIDTAGLRKTNNSIEQEGIKRSFQEAHRADIIILAFDSSTHLSEHETAIYQELQTQYTSKIITVHTKSDTLPINYSYPVKTLPVSSVTHYNIDILEHSIQKKITALFQALESPFLLNKRQFNLLLTVEKNLIIIQEMLLQKNIAYELISYHINDTLAHLGEITGKTISEQAMDTVFKEFCVGK